MGHAADVQPGVGCTAHVRVVGDGGFLRLKPHLWRGSLLPLDCAAVPAFQAKSGAATRPSGSKLPRHRDSF
ncbi:hypothetical protein DBR46_20385 [Pseudomonas sp. KBW05]|nr:hypothetical protein DBR46_20385 [Pseudomonas sp. KBW05]